MEFKLAFIFWALMVAIAIVNGLFGEFVLTKYIGSYPSHIYRTFFAVIVIFLFARFFVLKTVAAEGPWYMPALPAGIQWFASSLIFEFIFGHFVFGLSWEKILAEYRISQGRLWSLVLASELAAPVIFAYLLRRA